GLRADVFNLPATRELVEATAQRCGLQDRMGFVSGDFLRGSFPRGYDTLAFVRVLHDWPAETALDLLANARDALEPGALLLICEEFRTPERLAAQFFWTYFLQGVDNCVSRLRETAFYTDALAQAGFERIAVLAGPFELIAARKAR
ncbi:MAG TPA: methyltransferase, partial [Burkholderiaceae bacterium]